VLPRGRALLADPARRATALSLCALAALSFLQRPGQVTFDTKLDLVVNPIGFLARAMHLWAPQATSGELQDQAYGYLFPMGPFFALAQLGSVPMWVAQRLWCALLLGGAYLGLLLVARAMGIGRESTRQVGALAYALAPRMLTEVGSLSAEMLPAVMLPWVLLPLLRVDRIGSPRRAAGLSALAVLCMGGVNGSMVLMALVLPVLWLLTRRFTGAHVRLVAWWCVAVAASILWWFLPLLLLGRYSLPFLNYIESSTTTTAVVSLFQAVRGTNQWVAYIVQGEPWWPAGWVLVDNPVLMAATMLVAAVGLAGLTRRGLPERRFLVLGLLAGLVLLTVGYVGRLDSPLATVARHLLDGPLAAFRNVHKFEPVLRVPLALGLAHGAALGIRRWRPWRRALPALLLVAVAAAPAWLVVLRAGPGWPEIPGYWRQAATWLGEQDRAARTLMVPATGFGDYTWGHTVDEPMQGLARAPWAVRNQVPLGSEGNTRVMDAVEQVLDSGRGSAGLADFLARSGYRYVLLRNDIDRARTGAPPIAVLRQALLGSPGLVRAATFGPEIVPDVGQASPVDVGAQPPPALEVYEVQRPVPQVSAVDGADVATVSGGPESLLPLLGAGLLARDQPAVLAGDLGTPSTGTPSTGTPGSGGTIAAGAGTGGPWLVSDGLRRRERNPGQVRDNVSQTLTAGETARQPRSALDILPFPAADHQTVAVLQGVQSVTASTSASYADAYGGSVPSYQPFAAIDGDENTAWHSSSPYGPVGQWLEVHLDTPRRLDQVQLSFVNDLRVGWPVTRIRITTDAGSVEQDVENPAGPHRYAVPAGLTATVRVTVLAVAGARTTGNVGIRELGIVDTAASRALRVPFDVSPPAGQAPAFSFSQGDDARSSCVTVDGVTRCDPLLGRPGEEPEGIDRLFRTPSAAHYSLALTALPRPGGPVPLLGQRVTATASSWLDGDPAVAPYAAVDGDPASAWIADLSDQRPTLSLRWSGTRSVGEIRIRPAGWPAASTPTILEVRSPGGSRLVRLDAEGVARFAPLRTDQLDIVIRDVDTRTFDRRYGAAVAPAGLAELQVPALADLMRPLPPTTAVGVPCGQGPVIQLDGTSYTTSVTGTLGDIVAHRPLPVTICDLFLVDGADLAAGEHELRTLPSVPFAVHSAMLKPARFTAPAVRHRDVTVDRWGDTARTVHIGAGGAALLVVPENANAGWVATLDGRPLAAARVDGWQQAWLVLAGSGGTIELTFTPDRPYRNGLAVGGLGVLAAAALVVLPVRRRRPVPAAVPSRSRLLPAVLLALVAVLGGVLPVVFVIVAMLARQLRPGSLKVLALGGAVVATAVAVTGRVLGHGQSWAYGPWAQGAMLAAVAAVVAACLRAPRGAPLDEGATGDQQPGAAAGGTGDLGDSVVQPQPHEDDLGADGEPDRQRGEPVPAGDAGEHQQLGHGEQRPGEREEPDGHPWHGVARAADQPQQPGTGQADHDNGRVQHDHDRERGADDPAAMSRVGEAGQRDHADGLG
jgi:arabinofuranan 3-O-arabinosyltransferase